MSNKKMNLKIRTKSTCPAKDVILKAIDTIDGTAAKVKTIISLEKEDGLYPLYIDEVKDENLYGMIKEFDGEMDDDLMKKIVNENTYTILLTGRKGNNITGVLEINQNIISADEKASDIPESVQKALDKKVAEGIVDETEGLERIRVMMDNHVDHFLMTRVVKKWRKYGKATKRPDCIYVDPFLNRSLKKHQEPIISEILRDCTAGHGIIFEGEKSVGKNVCATTVAWLLGMPERLLTCDRQMTPASIYGEKTTDNSAMKKIKELDPETLILAEIGHQLRKTFFADYYRNIRANSDMENLTIEWAKLEKSIDEKIPQQLKDAMKKEAEFKKASAEAASTSIIIEDSELVNWLQDGGVFILNEMNLGDPNLLASFLNPILDGTGYLTVLGRGEVTVNPDCVLIATQNPDYVGCEMQNEATLSRLACECFEQPDSIKDILNTAVKAQLKKDEWEEKIDSKFITQADAFYVACCKAVEDGLISNAALNIRGYVRALVNVYESYGYSTLSRQLEIQVLNTCPNNEKEALRATLKTRVTL